MTLQRDLADFWCYSIAENRWTCLSRDTSRDGGPCARSCHKLCFDEERQQVSFWGLACCGTTASPLADTFIVSDRQLYVLGRFVESGLRSEGLMQPDFFRYDVVMRSWECLQTDTAYVLR